MQILVYLARHGTTLLNQDGCFRGPIDVPLDASGVRDAKQLHSFFKSVQLGDILCSDKQRAHETAKIIAAGHPESPRPTPLLHAWNIGYLAGQKKDDHTEDIEFFQNHPAVQIPEGQSLDSFRARVRPVFKQAIQRALQTGLPVLLVTHSSVIHEVGQAVNGDHNSTVVRPGGVAVIGLRDGKLAAEPLLKPDSRQAEKVIS